MLGNEKFRVGQRVRPSAEGIEANVFHGTYRGEKKSEWSGVVVHVSEFNAPTVKWDALKGTSAYSPFFITADYRSHKRRSPTKMAVTIPSRIAEITKMMLADRTIRSAVKYISPDTVVKVTRRWKVDYREKTCTLLVTFGRPNYAERKFIKAAVKAEEPFPIRKVQLRHYRT